MSTSEKLLKEYIREILKEDDGGHAGFTAGDIMSAGMDMSPYGMHYGSSEDLYKIFIKPFTDVFHTAAGKTKELSVKAQTLAKVTFETIASSFIPRFEVKYKKIFEHEQKQIEQIKQQYHDIYAANWDAFRDNDALCAAFMYSPAALLTAAFARKSPQAAGHLISVLSGGTLDPWLERLSDKMSGFEWWGKNEPPKTGLEVPNKAFKHGDNWHRGERHRRRRGGRGTLPNNAFKHGDNWHSTGPISYGESRLYEKVGKKKNAKSKVDLPALLSSEKVKQKLQQSNVVQELEKQGKAIVRNTLSQVFKQAQGALTAKTLHDVQTKTGIQLPGIDKLNQLPPEEKQLTERAILQAARKGIKQLFVTNLEGQVKAAIAAGIDENSEYVQDYRSIISKINSL